MKIIDENGKIGGKLNLVDLGIILLLILAIVAVGYKALREQLLERESVTIDYTLLVENVRDMSVESINKVHENITDAENDDLLGNIVDIKVEDATGIVQKADGEYVKATYPDKYDLYITIETKGTATKDGYFTESGKKILYGDTIGINNSYSQMFGVVEHVEIKK